MKALIVCAMVFFHILDDFVLQSAWLANGKQKSWWENNAPEPMYKDDYIVALFMHAFSWSFMIMIPLIAYTLYNGGAITNSYAAVILFNTAIHAGIDDMKANRRKINLIEDQSLHILQILWTPFILGVF